MPATSTVSPTGNLYIDGVLSGVKWAASSLTFSFPTDPAYYGSPYGSGENLSGFSAFSATQQTAVRKILANVSAVSISAVHGNGGDVNTTRRPALRRVFRAWHRNGLFSKHIGNRWRRLVQRPNQVRLSGHRELRLSHHAARDRPCARAKHSHTAYGSFAAISLDRDSLEYTVMSYRSYTGGPATAYTVEAYGYPQTLMMYDVAALQTMYGANYTTNSGDTVYKWNPLTGQQYIDGVAQALPGANKILMNVWDGGGRDTYDFSNYTTNLKVDLNPGSWTITSTAQLSNLGGGHLAAGTYRTRCSIRATPRR